MKPPSSTDPFTDEGFLQLVERAEQDPAASQELDLLADVLAAAELEHERLSRAPAPQPPSFAWQGKLAAAATILFLAVLGFWLLDRRREGTPASLADRSAPRYLAAALREPDEPLDDAFERAMERYTAGEYDPAARALSTWLEAHPEHGPARFYLAAAREQLGQPSEAEADYRRVAEEQEGSLGEHARWRLANLLLARGEVQRARSELERLTSSTAGFAAQARELLERLPR